MSSVQSIDEPLRALQSAGTVTGVVLAEGSDVIRNRLPFSNRRIEELCRAVDGAFKDFAARGRHVDQMVFGYDAGNVVAVASNGYRLIVMHLIADEVDFLARAAKALLADMEAGVLSWEALPEAKEEELIAAQPEDYVPRQRQPAGPPQTPIPPAPALEGFDGNSMTEDELYSALAGENLIVTEPAPAASVEPVNGNGSHPLYEDATDDGEGENRGEETDYPAVKIVQECADIEEEEEEATAPVRPHPERGDRMRETQRVLEAAGHYGGSDRVQGEDTQSIHMARLSPKQPPSTLPPPRVPRLARNGGEDEAGHEE